MTLTVVPPLPVTPLSIQAPALPRRRIYAGDSLWVLAHLLPDSLDALVCDPPAGIGFMGKEWDTPGALVERKPDTSVAWDRVGGNHHAVDNADKVRTLRVEGAKFRATLMPIFRQCLRVLKPGAHGLVWALPRTSHWTAMALEDAGFEVRDRFQHWFGSGFPKSMDISKAIDKAAGATREVTGTHASPAGSFGRGITMGGGEKETVELTAAATEDAKRWEGWGTALKPACEDWWLVRKPLNGSVVENVLALGTGALNIDASRIAGTPRATGTVNPHAESGVHGTYGRDARTDRQMRYDANLPTGRWPSHLLLTHAASCRRVGSKLLTATSEPITMDESEFDAVPVTGVEEVPVFECDPSCPIRCLDEQTSDQEGASRFFQTFEQEPDPFLYAAKASRSDKGAGNLHPTVKSTKLMEYLIRMVTPPGGTVLDPFGGSGTTAVAAARLGFGYLLCEREPAYLDIICQRLQVERSTVMSLRLIQGGAVPPVPAPPPRNFLVVHPKDLSEEALHALWAQIGQALIPASGGQPFEVTMAIADWRVNFEKSGGWQEWINTVVGRGYASGSYRYAGFVVAGRMLGQASAQIVKLALVRRAPVVIYEPGAPLREATRVYQISADWREGFRVD